ncbi:MAG: Huntingtin interacting protein E-like protein [Parcubacteria group bacterium GW2011_GWA2_43_13]|nr:MAG: Huntingtin interacting protein E-like protein [Parcubacteria group bacterium GW2011_GWA2_43_13]OGY69243.1 MAG: hypothetical protein A3B94_01780 [Candidatus Jacksonbacteria bacterium RIFCSPHIGHO2_02_FULL_43_10]OGY70395.1 MAG: hypothetical protein A2986_00360 [Candidatus Jacksonbacteria bacterium RIFCSPLOWO2_01_FULL_44_13]HAZ16589.1 hypothetical protein [Candidatus Jacksonbacteria bacterium]
MPQKKQSTEYISLTQAAQGTPYSQEYLSLRARQGKLKAVKQGRSWVTTRAWVDDYIDQSSWEQKKEAYNASGQKTNNFAKGGSVPGGKKQEYTSPVQYTQNKKQVHSEAELIVQNISQKTVGMCVPQPPKHSFSFWVRIGAVCMLFTRLVLNQTVLERVLISSLIGILAVTAFLGSIGFFQGVQPPSQGFVARIIAGTEVIWQKVGEVGDEWNRAQERIVARELIQQQEQSHVAGIKIYETGANESGSWTHALSSGMNAAVEKMINAVRLDE